MRTIRMGEIVSRSKKRTSDILFRPFNFKKWLILIFIALLAGELTNGSFNSNSNNNTAQKQQAAAAKAQAGQAATPAVPAGQTSGKAPAVAPAVAITIAAAAVILVLAAFFLFIYVSSRFTFVWFNAVVSNDASIVEPFARHRVQGNSLFRASIALIFFFIITVALPVIWGISNAAGAGAFVKGFAWSGPVFMQLLFMPIVAIALIIIAWAIFAVAVGNFTVMIMALDGLKFIGALKVTAGIFARNPGDIVKYYFTLMGLSIACWFLAAVLGMAVVIAFLLIGAVLFGLGFLLFKLSGAVALAVIYGVITAVPWFAALVIAGMFVQLPFSVFLKAFSIEYLCNLDCGYTYERLDAYSKNRSREASKAAVMLPVVSLILVGIIFIGGLLAAIAIPNFIKARENASKASSALTRSAQQK